MIARIAVIQSDNPTMQTLPESLDGIVPADNKTVSVKLLGSDIRRAFIFKAKHPPVVPLANGQVRAQVVAA